MSKQTALNGIIRAYQEHQDLLIFALIGQTGSGCTTAANLLTSEFDDDLARPDISDFRPSDNGSISHIAENKKNLISIDFAKKNWQKFSAISVSTLIFSFIASHSPTKNELSKCLGKAASEIEIDSIIKSVATARKSCAGLFSLIQTSNPPKLTKSNCTEKIKNQATIVLPDIVASLRMELKEKYSNIFQIIGNNIRSSGNPCQQTPSVDSMFDLPKRIVRIIEIIRETDKKSQTPTRIVIDAIRNPMELVYLRDRYAQLYAVAITTEDSDRRDRLRSLNITDEKINEIDAIEYSSKHNPYSSHSKLINQDIAGCLQKSDIFINNPGDSEKSISDKKLKLKELYQQLIRYYSLALRPGLVTPRRDERCMQVAFTAKANSGCISRQVGAAVADSQHVIRAIGWNDVARGQTPCALRSVDELLETSRSTAYSDLEHSNDELRSHIKEKFKRRSTLADNGLPCPFCFKDAANESILSKKTDPETKLKGNNQVHTRSLHAEENAFLQLINGGSSIRNGYLYTTASPCELCSKKAYQLAISEIIYIDPYPGISVSQIIMSGSTSSRPTLRLFSGAVGKAYHRLYEPMIPIKDEIEVRTSPN